MKGTLVILCIALCVFECLAQSPIQVRAKRQQCRCVRNPDGQGMTCSCGTPAVPQGSTLAQAEYQQQNELAYELQYAQPTQARCACLQIVFQGNPQYQCHCGDNNGNPLPATTTTTPAPTTTTTTQAPTTTMASDIPTSTQPQGQCQCIMIRISGPSSAQYQCNCQNTPAPEIITTPAPPAPPTPEPETIYPPIGTVNSTSQGCFCLDEITLVIQPQCGCQCDCSTMLCNMPSAVCECPQDSQGNTVQSYEEPITTTVATTTTAPTTTTTLPPVTLPQETTTVIVPGQEPPNAQYPLTTTCVMYVGVQASPCTCLPQYDQCAQNICCLKAKYRSYKGATRNTQNDEPSTLDMLMNVLEKIKTKLN